MKISLDWIGQYVNLKGHYPQEIANRLTMATAEVEDVEEVKRVVKGIQVAEIIDMEPIHTSTGKCLHIAKVDLGKGIITTVCGAPNARIGMKTAFAPAGAIISGGIEVKEQSLYGRKSQGILCSPRELGWGESHVGILSFPSKLAVGTDLGSLVPETDYIIEIDNKSITHRPDLWGHYGFARELAAVYKRELKPLELADHSKWDKLPSFPLEIKDEEACPAYCCIDLDGLVSAYSPVYMQYRLLSIGMRPINLIVDLTNYLMYEMGQPMHAFDGQRVRDIIVAPFGSDGKFVTLDGTERKMVHGDLMIWDNTGPIAIAGVMGGEESEIKEDTSRLLLESANFHPARIRRTSVRLGLRTDAGLRFEKGQPPYHTALSVRRFVNLLEESGQTPIIKSKMTCAGNTSGKSRRLKMKVDHITRTIGMEIPEKKVSGILSSLGFASDIHDGYMTVDIPPHRSAKDISIPNDIVEEVSRIYGYDNIKPSMPSIELSHYHFDQDTRKQYKIQRYLSSSRGFNEVMTYSWYDDVWLKSIGYQPENTLTLLNPASENSTRMRREIIPNLFALVEPNSVHRDRFSLYEIGQVYLPVENGVEQPRHLAGLVCQTDRNGTLQDLFLSLKGAVEGVFTMLDSPSPVFTPAQRHKHPWETSGTMMDISIDGKKVGTIGYLSGKMTEVFEKGTQVAWFELNLDIIPSAAYPQAAYSEIPVFPGSWMDFSILHEKGAGYKPLSDILDRFSSPILRKRRFLYLYDGKGLPEGKASYTFRFWLGLKERTLTGDDITEFRSEFLAYLKINGLELR